MTNEKLGKALEYTESEPVGLMGALNTALLATWGVIVIVAEIDSVAAGAVTAAIGAWVGVGSWFVRARVTPA